MSTTPLNKARWRLEGLDTQVCAAIANGAEPDMAAYLARRLYRAAVVVERLTSERRIAQGLHRMHAILWRMDEKLEERRQERLKVAGPVRSRATDTEKKANDPELIVEVRGSCGSDAHPWVRDTSQGETS